jgi:hypothetical protein
MNDLEKEDYYKAAQWKKDDIRQTISLQRKEILIIDSFTGPHEDFSNNVEIFLFKKESLKKNPELIKYLEKIIK